MGNWWADKLGVQQPTQARQVPQPYPQPYPPQQYQQPGYQPQPYPQYQQPQPRLTPEQQQALASIRPKDYTLTQEEMTALRVPPGSSPDLMLAAVAANLTGGSRAVKRFENQHCPECGDPRYFTRSHPKLAKLNTNTGQMVSPSPRCQACGFNGLYEQYGTMVDVVGEEQGEGL